MSWCVVRVIDVHAASRPTIQDQLDHMNILVRDAMPGDSLFLHCRSPCLLRVPSLIQYSVSGHGGQITDLDGDEADGLDEGTQLCWIIPDLGRPFRCSDLLCGREHDC